MTLVSLKKINVFPVATALLSAILICCGGSISNARPICDGSSVEEVFAPNDRFFLNRQYCMNIFIWDFDSMNNPNEPSLLGAFRETDFYAWSSSSVSFSPDSTFYSIMAADILNLDSSMALVCRLTSGIPCVRQRQGIQDSNYFILIAGDEVALSFTDSAITRVNLPNGETVDELVATLPIPLGYNATVDVIAYIEQPSRSQQYLGITQAFDLDNTRFIDIGNDEVLNGSISRDGRRIALLRTNDPEGTYTYVEVFDLSEPSTAVRTIDSISDFVFSRISDREYEIRKTQYGFAIRTINPTDSEMFQELSTVQFQSYDENKIGNFIAIIETYDLAIFECTENSDPQFCAYDLDSGMPVYRLTRGRSSFVGRSNIQLTDIYLALSAANPERGPIRSQLISEYRSVIPQDDTAPDAWLDLLWETAGSTRYGDRVLSGGSPTSSEGFLIPQAIQRSGSEFMVESALAWALVEAGLSERRFGEPANSGPLDFDELIANLSRIRFQNTESLAEFLELIVHQFRDRELNFDHYDPEVLLKLARDHFSLLQAINDHRFDDCLETGSVYWRNHFDEYHRDENQTEFSDDLYVVLWSDLFARIGYCAINVGDRSLARSALLESRRLDPFNILALNSLIWLAIPDRSELDALIAESEDFWRFDHIPLSGNSYSSPNILFDMDFINDLSVFADAVSEANLDRQ